MLTEDPSKRATIAQIKEHRYFTNNLPYGWHETTRALLEEGRLEGMLLEAEDGGDDDDPNLYSAMTGITNPDDYSWEMAEQASGELQGTPSFSIRLQSSDQLLFGPEDDDIYLNAY